MSPTPDLLVIDDNDAIANIVCAVVQTMGMTCQQVHGPVEFLQAVANGPKWIVMDLNMPEMDGPELLRLLAEQGTAARIVLMSGSLHYVLEEAAAQAKGLELNVAGVLVKPFRVAELMALLRGAA